MSWLRRIFPPKITVDDTHTFRVSPSNTAEMQGQQWTRMQDVPAPKGGVCPNCGSNEWWSGPEGGMSVNVECGVCHLRWNANAMGMSWQFIGRGPKYVEPAMAALYKDKPEYALQAAIHVRNSAEGK